MSFPSKHGPVRDCVICGCPTRGSMGFLENQPAAGVVAFSVPLCGMHEDQDGCWFDAMFAADEKFRRMRSEGHEFRGYWVGGVDGYGDILRMLMPGVELPGDDRNKGSTMSKAQLPRDTNTEPVEVRRKLAAELRKLSLDKRFKPKVRKEYARMAEGWEKTLPK